jgi:hypothetical protein
MSSPTIPPGLSPNEILAWMGAQVAPPASSAFQQPLPPPLEPPTGDPSETNTTQWAVKETDTDIALASMPTTVVVGSVFLIDEEYMTVASVSNPENPAVVRGAYNTVPATHEAGAAVSIWSDIS